MAKSYTFWRHVVQAHLLLVNFEIVSPIKPFEMFQLDYIRTTAKRLVLMQTFEPFQWTAFVVFCTISFLDSGFLQHCERRFSHHESWVYFEFIVSELKFIWEQELEGGAKKQIFPRLADCKYSSV